MKQSLSMVTLSALTLASSAQAATLYDHYKFDTAVQAYRDAISILEGDGSVSGAYHLVATASRSYRGDFLKKDITGLKNEDGSLMTLNFTVSGTSVSVLFQNLGTRGQNQGPAMAVYDETNGIMSFAQYSYRAGRLNDDVYFFSECRHVGMAAQMAGMLCAKRFIVNHPDRVNDQQRALHNTIVSYDLYTQ